VVRTTFFGIRVKESVTMMSMKFGIAIFPTDYAISMSELAPAVERLGFESLWVAEHSHIPASRESRWPGGAELPKHYWHTLDPFLALTVAALASKTLRIATGICLVTQRDPIHTAKQVASLDHISNGRFLFGIGAGWNREEMADHGTDFSTRMKLLRERVEAMKAIWTQDEAQYHGQFVNFDPIFSYPKPVQKPHPPILMGGGVKAALRAVVQYCDGWLPARSADFFGELAQLRQLAAEAGRDPKTISVTCFFQTSDQLDQDRALIERYQEAGVERIILWLSSKPRDVVLPEFDKLSRWTR
jgi:probable F420-dependent oxidoreductase